MRQPRNFLRGAKRKAAAEGRKLTALIEAGLLRIVGGRRQSAKLARSPPPVSAATGGLMPGVDLDDTAAMQDAEDRGFAQRLRQSWPT